MSIQILDCGKVSWIEKEVHNYAHLLHTTVPAYPAMLAAKADLAALCAYSTRYVPPDALEELTAYLLSWAASTSPSNSSRRSSSFKLQPQTGLLVQLNCSSRRASPKTAPVKPC